MRRWSDLSLPDRDRAVAGAVREVLQILLECDADLFDRSTMKRVRAACARAEAHRTPWFAAEHVMDDCSDAIRALARQWARDAWYPDPGEQVLYL